MTTPIAFELLRVGHCTHPECVAIRGGRWRAVRFPSLVGLLIHPTRGPLLFDTGYGEGFFHATRPFPERFYRWTTPAVLPRDESLVAQLARRGIAPGDVDTLLLSHLHADHVAGLVDFPRVGLVAMRAEVEAMRGRNRIGALRRGFLPALLPDDFATRVRAAEDCARVSLPTAMRPFLDGFDLLGDGSLIGVPLPGHTAGQLGVLFRAADGRDVFLVADACWTLAAVEGDRPPTWIASQLFADRRGYLETFARLRELHARRDDLLVVPSHCEATFERCRDGDA